MNEENKQPEAQPSVENPVTTGDATPGPVYVIAFKGARKEYYRDPYGLTLKPGNYVILQVERGEDMGRVVQELAPAKIKGAKVKPLPILRAAGDEDLRRDADNRAKELDARQVCRRMAGEHGLKMKVVDAEWQFDGNKMTFYFTAEKRVDFRQLVKELAGVYKTRIELRQIGARDEARRVGGVGVCGYEQCCTMFMKEFEPVTTQLARDQRLSLNPSKISGNCGRLLCCLRYESTYYKQAIRQYPEVGRTWETEEGTGTIDDIHILRDRMVVRLPDGQKQHVSLEEIQRARRKKQSWFD
jgi:cell fate regulator YaaT (PSP1 superfamily)